MIPWLIAGLAAILLGALLYWLLITTEGVYLGRRMVVLLYDRAAPGYDALKEFDPPFEAHYLGRPFVQRLVDVHRPRILDVASGTGRVPLLLLDEPDFHGIVVGLEPSRKMLAEAIAKGAPYGSRVSWVRQTAVPLPFRSAAFDAVSCIEALEFMPDEAATVREMLRVLRPGGLFLLTRRQGRDARLFPGRYRDRQQMVDWLNEQGLVDIVIRPWQVDYDLVWASKAG